jgi:arylformamidase
VADEWRVQFDAEISFRNGGGLSAREFRLDVPDPDVDEAEVGRLLVRHLGLLMVDRVEVRDLVPLREPHKGSRGVLDAAARPPSQPVDLTRVDPPPTYLSAPPDWSGAGAGAATDPLPLARLVDLDGLVVRTLGSHRPDVDRSALLPYDVRGRAVLLHTGHDTARLTLEAARWLVTQGAALVAVDTAGPDSEVTGAGGATTPAAAALLAGGIPVVGRLAAADRLPPTGFRFSAVPAAGAAGAVVPVRAYAVAG